MRALKVAVVAMFFSTAGACQTVEDGYSLDCKIAVLPDGSKVEKCNEKTVTKIFTLCMHDTKGQPYETEAIEMDIEELLAMHPKNFEGPCK